MGIRAVAYICVCYRAVQRILRIWVGKGIALGDNRQPITMRFTCFSVANVRGDFIFSKLENWKK